MPELLRLMTVVPEVEGQDHYGSVSESGKNDMSGTEAMTPMRSVGSYQKSRNSICGRYEGLFYALLSSVAIVIGSSLRRDLKQYSAIGIAFYSALFSASFNFPMLIWNIKTFPKTTKQIITQWVALSVSTGLGLIFRTLAFQMLPIGEASSICFSSPIFTAIFARVILKDRLTWMTMMSLIVSVIGLLLIMRLPELITSEDERLGSMQHLIGCCCALASVVVASANFIILRSLRDAPSLVNTFMQSFGSCIVCACIAPAFAGFFIPPCDVTVAVKLVSISITLFLCQFLMSLALQKDDPTTIGTIYRSAEIVFGFLVQLIIFKESADAYSISGAIVIFACGLLTPLQKWMEGQKEGSFWRESCLIK